MAYKITYKQRALCEAYVRYNGDARMVAEELGMKSVSNVYSLMKNEACQKYLKMLNGIKETIAKKALHYSLVESFNNLVKVQKLALEKKKTIAGKFGIYKCEDADLGSYLKAEEMKGKLAGLYGKEEDKKPVTVMNIIRYDDKNKVKSTSKGDEEGK